MLLCNIFNRSSFFNQVNMQGMMQIIFSQTKVILCIVKSIEFVQQELNRVGHADKYAKKMRHTQYIKTRLKSRLHGWPRDTGWQLGMNQSFLKNARGVRILVYHGVCTDHPFQYNTLFLSRQGFERQLKLFKKYFHFLSIDDVYEQRFAEDRFHLC